MRQKRESSVLNSILKTYMGGFLGIVLLLLATATVILYYTQENYLDTELKYVGQDVKAADTVMDYISQELSAFRENHFTDWQDWKNGQISTMKLRWILQTNLETLLSNSSEINCGFVENNVYEIKRFQSTFPMEEQTAISAWTRENRMNVPLTPLRTWMIQKIEGKYYLYQCIAIGDIKVGVIADLDALVEKIVQDIGVDADVRVLFENEEIFSYGERTAREGIFRRAEVFGLQSGAISLEVILPFDYYSIQLIIIAVAFLISIVVVLLFGLYARKRFSKLIYRPVKELQQWALDVARGGSGEMIPAENTSGEIKDLTDSFNYMVEEMRKAKIAGYEAELASQKRELNLHHLQLRPHFYLNAMNSIKALTYGEDMAQTRAYIDALSGYIRYMINIVDEFVPVSTEIRHIERYLEMQEVKAPDSVMAYYEVDKDIQDFFIPSFTIYTLVENSVKHAMSSDEPLILLLRCQKEGEGIRILVEDNGAGYKEEILRSYQHIEDLAGTGSIHIGLSNLRKTMVLLYGRDDLVKLSNKSPKGARTEVVIPFELGKEKKGEEEEK